MARSIYDIVSILKKPDTNDILRAVGNILDNLNSVTGTSEELALKLKKYRHGYIEGSLGNFYEKFLAGDLDTIVEFIINHMNFVFEVEMEKRMKELESLKKK